MTFSCAIEVEPASNNNWLRGLDQFDLVQPDTFTTNELQEDQASQIHHSWIRMPVFNRYGTSALQGNASFSASRSVDLSLQNSSLEMTTSELGRNINCCRRGLQEKFFINSCRSEKWVEVGIEPSLFRQICVINLLI